MGLLKLRFPFFTIPPQHHWVRWMKMRGNGGGGNYYKNSQYFLITESCVGSFWYGGPEIFSQSHMIEPKYSETKLWKLLTYWIFLYFQIFMASSFKKYFLYVACWCFLNVFNSTQFVQDVLLSLLMDLKKEKKVEVLH